MRLPDINHFALNKGIALEPEVDADRLILWVATSKNNAIQDWERISNLAGADVEEKDGVCSMAAMLMPFQQMMRGFWLKMWGRFTSAADTDCWMTPDGEAAEPAGRKRTDLRLVWSHQVDSTLDEEQIKDRWPARTLSDGQMACLNPAVG